MSVRRALVDCAVLSLQDSCVFYPCCKSCFSRIDTDQLDTTTRCRCSRCGYRCLRDQVDYRYRLSLWVTRDSCIFGVTVFGNSLNAFFGIRASELQKLVENVQGPVEPSTRSRLLVKAVRDCFIGRHFIFGIKLTGTESGPWCGGPGSNGSSRRESAQFVASQMILPESRGLAGCTVLGYFHILLQKASDYEAGSADPAAPLLLGPATSSSYSNASLCASGLLSQSQLRSQHHPVAPTPLWERSLGVVTSSAEQEEEGCSTQDSGDDNSRQIENSTTSHPELEKHKVTEEAASLLPSEQSFCNSSSFIGYSNVSFGAIVGNGPGVKSCFSPAPPVCKSFSLIPEGLSTSQHARSILSSSLAWEDPPFSESLTEFLNKDFEVVGEIKPCVQSEKESPGTHLVITNPAVKWTPARQRNARIRTGRPSILSDISNAPAPEGGDGLDLADQEHNRPEDENVSRRERISASVKAFLSFEEEEQLEENSYNCSADLFSNSLGNSRDGENTDTEPGRSTTGKRWLSSKTEQQSPRDENSAQLTPQRLQINKYSKRDSSSHGTEHFDFVPPSQSTPIVKLGVVTQSLSMSVSNRAGELSKEMLMRSRRSHRRSNSFTPRRKFRKTDQWLQVGQDIKRSTLNSESARTINYEQDSGVKRVTVCDSEDDDGVVAPTPVGKTLGVLSRRRQETEGGSSDLGLIRKANQRNGVGCQRLVQNQTLASPHRREAQTVNSKTQTVDEERRDGSNDNHLDDAHQSCDWSRDLFSDSAAE